MAYRELVITGCILFEGQGTTENNIIEVNDFHFFRNEEDASEFGDKYLDQGGDSFAVISEEFNFTCVDKLALAKLEELKAQYWDEIREIKTNGVLISSVMDEVCSKIDLLEKWKHIFKL